MFFHSIVLRKSQILHAPQVQCRPHKLRNRAFSKGLFPEVQFYCHVTQFWCHWSCKNTSHAFRHYCGFPKWSLRVISLLTKNLPMAPDNNSISLWFMKNEPILQYEYFPFGVWIYFQSVLSHIEDSGSSCLHYYYHHLHIITTIINNINNT